MSTAQVGQAAGAVIDLTDATRALRATPTAAPSLPRRLPGRALLVGSAGGHLAQLLPLAALWEREDRAFVTFDTPDARSQLNGERTFWAHHPTTRNVPNLVRNTVLAARVLRQVRPDVVVSTGAGVALAFFAAARAQGVPTVYLEVLDRVDTATLTGRLCAPLTTRFLVQWDEQRAAYPQAVTVGRVL